MSHMRSHRFANVGTLLLIEPHQGIVALNGRFNGLGTVILLRTMAPQPTAAN
ncbi:MAG TPA: hypothetical protein VF245_02435 [Solirubrobacterales bacterium]